MTMMQTAAALTATPAPTAWRRRGVAGSPSGSRRIVHRQRGRGLRRRWRGGRLRRGRLGGLLGGLLRRVVRRRVRRAIIRFRSAATHGSFLCAEGWFGEGCDEWVGTPVRKNVTIPCLAFETEPIAQLLLTRKRPSEIASA